MRARPFPEVLENVRRLVNGCVEILRAQSRRPGRQ